MVHEHHQMVGACLAAAGPLFLLAFGVLPVSLLNRNSLKAARVGGVVALASLGCALGTLVTRVWNGRVDIGFVVAGPFRLGIFYDNLSAIVLTLVAFLIAVIARYSVNYLAGDPAQGRFTKWLCLTGGSVLLIVVSGNLAQFALAWSATSLCLHQLLVLYPGRPGAVLAARKKFMISRLGDACLVTVIALAYRQFGTWDFSELFTAAKRLHEPGSLSHPSQINTLCFLVVAGAMLKSAQFPFHSWLPDTMETPTPVSALMHAGIINAGGFLIMRLSPLVTLSPGALSLLAICGAFTALFASLVMLTHASVKRCLAFSTVAQMGFMMLECGLGAFGLAALHLVAHSVYKAHAFLSSGSIVSLAKAAWTPTEKPAAHPLPLFGSLAVAVTLAFGCGKIFGLEYRHEGGLLVLSSVLVMALSYALWNLWARSLNVATAVLGVILGGGILASYQTLHRMFGRLIGEDPWSNLQLTSWPGIAVLGTLVGLFFLVLLVQAEMPQWANQPFFQAMYVHARNGFYFNTLANRAVAMLWPVKLKASKN